MERRTELQRTDVLRDCPIERPRLRVRLTQFGMAVRQLGGVVCRNAGSHFAPGNASSAKRPLGILLSAELRKDDPTVNVRLDVPRIQGQRLVEGREGTIGLPHELVTQAHEVVRVSEGPPRLHQLLEQVDRAVIVLELKALLRQLKLLRRTHVHKSPRTIPRIWLSRPRWQPSGRIRALAAP